MLNIDQLFCVFAAKILPFCLKHILQFLNVTYVGLVICKLVLFERIVKVGYKEHGYNEIKDVTNILKTTFVIQMLYLPH